MPARRALERPMAIACWGERAPCLPWRISSISSRTNSPAAVVAALPSRKSLRAFSIVCFLGIAILDRRCAVAHPANTGRSALFRAPPGTDRSTAHRSRRVVFLRDPGAVQPDIAEHAVELGRIEDAETGAGVMGDLAEIDAPLMLVEIDAGIGKLG